MNEDNLPPVGSKYNSGIDKIYTMSQIRKGCHDFKISGNLQAWYQCLRSWRSEMNSKFEEEEKDKCNNYHKLFETYFFKRNNLPIIELIWKTIGKDKKITEEKETIDTSKLSDLEIDNSLYNYELYLGDLAEKYKMGMPDAEDDEGL